MMGDRETGVTLMKMDVKMDHGPIIAQMKSSISPDENRKELTTRLTDMAFELFKTNLNNTNETIYQVQEHDHATVTSLFTKEDGFIPFPYIYAGVKGTSSQELPQILRRYLGKYNHSLPDYPAETIHNLYRGLYEWPGIWTKVDIQGQEKRLKITVCSLDEKKLIIERVQLEGKNEVDFHTFQEAYKIF
jgi:methionyl-tRNA formyltransferase